MRSKHVVKLTVLSLLLVFFVTGCTGCAETGKKPWWKIWGKGEPKESTPVIQPPTAKETLPSVSADKTDDSSALPPAIQRPSKPIRELEKIHFDFDKSNLKPEARAILDKNAEYLLEHPKIQVLIQGHCDVRGTIEYNYNLGNRRAMAAREYLIQKGIAPSRLHPISLGEENPIDPGMTEESHAKNRRDEFHIYPTE